MEQNNMWLQQKILQNNVDRMSANTIGIADASTVDIGTGSVNSDRIKQGRYEVVRQDYFFSQEEPQFTFKNGKAYINSFGLRQFPDKDYIQILIDKEAKTMIIKPFKEKVKDSFRWSAGKKRQPRHMRCVPLYCMVYQMMGWNLNARYRITGCLHTYGEVPVLYFDLTEAICFVHTEPDTNGNPVVREYFPKEWETSFGTVEAEYTEKDYIKTYEEEGLFEVKLPLRRENLIRMMERKQDEVAEVAPQ